MSEERNTLQHQVSDLQTELSATQDRHANELEEQELLQSALQEEIEVGKKELELKDRQLDDSKGDMAMLSKIVKDMTALNNELNEKISGMNAELEKLNSENF
jgi:chromosome segregation ATPase